MERIALLAWLLPLLAFALIAALLYRQAFDHAALAVDRASRIAQEQALKLFETNAMLLQRMLDLWGEASDDEFLARGEDAHQRLKRMVADLPQVQGVYMNSAGARALNNSIAFPPPRDLDYSDREWYRVHRSSDVGAFFTEQLKSRVTGEPFFDMSLRRNRRDGSFGGTVHASLKPSYLTDFYAELAQAEPGLRFVVLRSDGKLIARYPSPVPENASLPADDPVLALLRSSTAVVHSRGPWALDGVERLRVLRRLEPYSLWVVAAMSVSDVRAGWLRQVGWLALFAVPAMLTLVWLSRLALRRTREELDAARRLDDETAKRQRVEIALLQSQKLEALGRLTGGVAHDFNNLLMVVSNNLYILRHRRHDLADSAQLDAIERAVTTGSKLTRQLLSFSRRQALVPERVELGERLPALVDLLAPVLGKGIRISTRIEGDLPAIEVDPAELELALINLALNANDAMPGGGQLDIVARSASADEAPASGRRFAVVEVADTGSGIAPEIVDRVFEPFFTTKPVGKGTGLGLSQVQTMCQRAGGIARVASREGGGTTISMLFPALAADAAPAIGRNEAAAPRRLECRLLLVEDNDAVANASRDVLAAMGCEVERVASGERALATLAERSGDFDIVLSDIEMPGALDGIALAERIHASYPRLPVLLMTGYAARLEQAVRQKIEVLPKPVSPRVLSDSIAKALAGAATARRA
jgi:signal transduction histidine kinase/ActR/RegA family two-component response regulator